MRIVKATEVMIAAQAKAASAVDFAILVFSCSGDRCTKDRAQQPQRSSSGSIYGVGGRFQSFKINDLEMVAQILPRWNPLTSWMRQIEDFQKAA
jgi:hypothetical protein